MTKLVRFVSYILLQVVVVYFLLLHMANPVSPEQMDPTEFYSALRANQDFMEIPRSFYKNWKDEIGSTFILEDDIGNIFNVSLYLTDGKAYFVGIFAIRQHYLIPSGAILKCKYVGKDKFKFKVFMSAQGDENASAYPRQTNVHLLPGSSSNAGANRGNLRPGSSSNAGANGGNLLPGSSSNAGANRGNVEILWSNNITASLSTGNQALAVAGNIAEALLKGKEKINVRLEDGNLQSWSLIWTSTGQCRIGRGWYQYCRLAKPKKDDVLQFLKSDEEREDCFHVKLLRN